jgi:uncharacterized membrane protein YgcG
MCVRVITTGVVCVVAAFGAAFLVGRAINHPGASASAATTPTVALKPATVSRNAKFNANLAPQFTPESIRLRRIVHHKRKVVHHAAPASSGSGAGPQATPTPTYTAPQTTPTYTAPQTYTAPTYTPPAASPPSSGSSGSGSTTHHSSGGSAKKSGGGSGTTVIG